MQYSERLKTRGDSFFLSLIISLVISFAFPGCTGKSSYKKADKKSIKKVERFKLVKPSKNQIIRHNEVLAITLDAQEKIIPDSIRLLLNNKVVTSERIDSLDFTAKIKTEFVGNQTYQLKIYFSDSLSETHNLQLFILPATVPKDYSYKIIRNFKHDPGAYTQGLLYYNGHIYESTGKRKQSTIRRIDTKTGEVVKKKALEPQFFGEGIAVVGKEIYMATYISQVGLVYDAVTFDLIRKFDLQTKEGWGLTTFGDQIIMSDGSASLFFFDPKYFNLIKQIEVCDNKGFVTKINELEYTRHGLFANIYGEDYIVLIDESTGIVMGKVDLSDLFPKNIPDNYDHVLNGIAFNPETGTFYVTGKQWPVIYEISINLD